MGVEALETFQQGLPLGTQPQAKLASKGLNLTGRIVCVRSGTLDGLYTQAVHIRPKRLRGTRWKREAEQVSSEILPPFLVFHIIVIRRPWLPCMMYTALTSGSGGVGI